MQLTLYNEVFSNTYLTSEPIEDSSINLTAVKIAAAVMVIIVFFMRKKITASIIKPGKSYKTKQVNRSSETWT